MKLKLIILTSCIAIVAMLALPQQAQALQVVQYYRSVDMPVVSEVTTNGETYVATIEAKASKVTVYQGKHKIHADRVGKTVWMLEVQPKKMYTIEAKIHGKIHVIKWQLRR